MQKVMTVLGVVVQYIFLMILLNMGIVLISLLSFGLLAPISIYIAFMVLNAFMKKERISIKGIRLKSIGILTLISYAECIIIYQYIKVLPYVSLLSYETIFYIAFGIICVYFYIFNTYFMFLSLKDLRVKEALILSMIAPFHSIKQLILLILMLVISVIFLLNFSSLLLLIGVTILLVLNNIILENYYVAIKE